MASFVIYLNSGFELSIVSPRFRPGPYVFSNFCVIIRQETTALFVKIQPPSRQAVSCREQLISGDGPDNFGPGPLY